MKKLAATLILFSIFTACQTEKKDEQTNTFKVAAIRDQIDHSDVPAAIRHCQWSQDGINGFERTSKHLGDYTLCKSKTNEMEVYLQLKEIPENQICLIPTSNDQANSVYIGEPRCLHILNSKQIYKISVLKNRPGFENFAFTSAMLVKDMIQYDYGAPYTRPYYAIDAYLECFRMLLEGNNKYCQAFNQKGEHVFHQF